MLNTLDADILKLIQEHPFLNIRDADKINHIMNREEFIKIIQPSLPIVNNLSYRGDDLYDLKISDKTFENCDFSYTSLKDITFKKCYFINCRFNRTKFEFLEFKKCQFHNCYMNKITFDNTYIHIEGFEKCLNPKLYANMGVHMYQQLKKNFQQMQQPFLADEAHYKFMLWKRYQLNYEACKEWTDEKKIFTRININRLVNMLFQIALAYGTRLRNLIYTIFCIFLLFYTINYIFWEEWALNILIHKTKKYIDVLYYTSISLSNLGYGDITPTSYGGRLVASIQAVVGVVLFAIVASMIYRKITRR